MPSVSTSIILLRDGKPVTEYRIEGDKNIVLGRSSAADIHVRDAKLSRRHCQVRATSEGGVICDLGSKNGTFVNGARVTEAHLRDGDRVQIGLTRFLFRAPPATEPSTTDVATPHRCASCDSIIPLDQLELGRATRDRYFCRACIEATPLVGRTIAGYEIIRCIGRGTMGAVFKASQLSMQRDVALKILHHELSADPDAVRRFLREARAGGQFSHPNIIRIYDMNHSEGYCFISMEYVPGGDAASLLEREGPLPPAQVVDIATQVATALAHAHAKGVVHRDVKPSNLLLGRDGLIKLADLGLAKSLQAAGMSSLTGSGTVLGSLAYIPPEQLTDATGVDPRADVYSLGATCHHLLTGVPSFRGESLADLTVAITTQPPRSIRIYRDDVPQTLDNLIIHAMAKDPARRFQAADDMLAALQRIKL